MIIDFVTDFLGFLWLTFLLLAPMLLLGLFLSGVMHVFISRKAILRWFQRDGLKTVATSAAIGVPMPLCSCSVVPVVAEMRRKGASRSACMSFLITAPETGADSILVTNAFFGPVVAVMRPIVSFITAVVSGLFCIGFSRRSDPQSGHAIEATQRLSHESKDCSNHAHEHDSLFADRDDCYVSLRELGHLAWLWLRDQWGRVRSWRGKLQPSYPSAVTSKVRVHASTEIGTTPNFLTVLRHMFKYGFVEIADDILFALLVGIMLGGFLYFFIPADLMAHEYAQWLAYPVMLLIGIPLYICASASTPIAAALVAKGVSPGAALVFLMTGPATNTGTIAIIVSQFGSRFAAIYMGGVVVVTVILGLAIDFALLATGVSVAVNLDASDSTAVLALQWIAVLGLLSLIGWRFKAGALRSGINDLLINLKPMGHRIAEFLQRRNT